MNSDPNELALRLPYILLILLCTTAEANVASMLEATATDRMADT